MHKPLKSVMHGQCDTRPTVTFPVTGHRPLTKLCCSVTEAHVCAQLAQGCQLKVEWPGIETVTFCVVSQHPHHYAMSFPSFSRAKNLFFHRLLQQKANVIMTFIKGHSTSTPVPSILTDIYWAGSSLTEITMIQSIAVLHKYKYLNDKLKLLC